MTEILQIAELVKYRLLLESERVNERESLCRCSKELTPHPEQGSDISHLWSASSKHSCTLTITHPVICQLILSF